MSSSGSKPSPALRPALLAGAAIMIAAGAGIALILGETTIGLVVAGVGVVDLLTVPLLMRTLETARSSSASPSSGPAGAAEEPPAQPDPDYNPYARED